MDDLDFRTDLLEDFLFFLLLEFLLFFLESASDSNLVVGILDFVE